ncbi:hypothetical protein GINT2_001463 [Glugoides intestinalis]
MNLEISANYSRVYCICQLLGKMLLRQLYYIFGDISLFFTSSKRQLSNKQSQNLRSIESKADNSIPKDCMKSTEEHIKFSIKDSFVVLTDIIDSTRLYDEDPVNMKNYMILHYKIVYSLVKSFKGHIVSNEGDSFHLAFQHFDTAVRFCEAFMKKHSREISLFKVRIGISKGNLCVRKFSGYKVYGKSIEEALNFFRHNDGKKICLKKPLVSKYASVKQQSCFCIH